MTRNSFLRSASLAVAVTLAASLAAEAADVGSLGGFYRKVGGTVMLEIRGEAARVMFEGMTAKAKPDACTEGSIKTANGLSCGKAKDGSYLCTAGIVLKSPRIVPSDTSC